MKLYYSISEVSKLTGVKPYVLRYWESEFPFLKPKKEKRRLYKEKDIELIMQIKDLLYNKGYTLSGAKKKLKQNKIYDKINLSLIKKELQEILNILKK
jgi:DNA-binding transcriptional MerR regulator